MFLNKDRVLTPMNRVLALAHVKYDLITSSSLYPLLRTRDRARVRLNSRSSENVPIGYLYFCPIEIVVPRDTEDNLYKYSSYTEIHEEHLSIAKSYTYHHTSNPI